MGAEEPLFRRQGRCRTKQWYTSIDDVRGRQLLDISPCWKGRKLYLVVSGPTGRVA